MKIRDLFNFFQFERKLKRMGRREPFQVRPRVEELEPRLAPAQNTFTGAVSPAWGLAANWDTFNEPDRIPGPADNLVLGNPGSTGSSVVDAHYTVDRLDMDSSFAGPLFILAPGEDSITTTNYIDQWGVLRVFGGASINTNGTYYNTLGTIVANQALSINASTGVDDGGAIYVTGALAITTGAYVQNSAGIILVPAGGALVITATSQIVINGTLAVAPGGGLGLFAPTIIVHGNVLKAGPAAPPFVWPPAAPPPVSAISATTFFNQHGTVTTGPVFNYNDVAALVGGLPAAPIPGRIDLRGNSLTVDPGAQMNAGDGSQIDVTGTMTVQGTANLWHATATVGTLTLQGGTLLLNGTSYGPTTMTVNSALTVDAASTVTIQDSLSTLSVAGTVTDYGVINLINGKINTNGNTLVVKPSTGVLNMQGGSMIQVGTLNVQGTLNLNDMSGGGAPMITGNLNVSGTLAFNHTSNGVMILTLTGNYTQTGSLWMRINGAQSGMNDKITVTGTSSLGGDLHVSAYGTLGMGSWTLIDGTTTTGAFAGLFLPPPPPNEHWMYGVYSGDYKLTLMFGL